MSDRAWHNHWVTAFGTRPLRPSSREESAQLVLADVLLGFSPPYFLPFPLTTDGVKVIRAIWESGFEGQPPQTIDWLVSEYVLPVPAEWQAEIGLSYRAPDFVVGAGDRLLIIELKTEWGSYSRTQITDFLRLARRLHPRAELDLMLLEEHVRSVRRELDGGQRYAEFTWAQLAALLRNHMPGAGLAQSLCRFIDLSLSGTTVARTAPGTQESARLYDLIVTAVDQALHIAPALEADPGNSKLERGIDVPFPSDEAAREAEASIRAALLDAGHVGATTWLWRKASGGFPATRAGRDIGREIRIQPRK